MKTVKKGRPPRKEKRHVIWLTSSTLRLWNERRKAFGLKNKSNSEFAEVLLHRMFLKRTGRFDWPDNNNNKGAQRTLVVGGPLSSRFSLRSCSLPWSCRLIRTSRFPPKFQTLLKVSTPLHEISRTLPARTSSWANWKPVQWYNWLLFSTKSTRSVVCKKLRYFLSKI